MEHPSTSPVSDARDAVHEPRKRRGLARLFAWIWRLIAGPRRPRETRPAKISKTRPVPAPVTRSATGTELKADRVIRGVAIAILLAVAGAAAYVSYHHFYSLAIVLGERHDMAILYPAMSDGVIVMASLVMVYCSRRGIPVPVGAWAALILGGAVTLVANVAHGWSGGVGQRLLSALAPIAFVGAYELLMWLVRVARKAADLTAPIATPETAAVPVVEHVCQPETITKTVTETVVETVMVLPVDRFDAAGNAYADSLLPGKTKIGRQILSSRWGLTDREARDLMADVNERQQTGTETPAVPVSAGVEETDSERYSAPGNDPVEFDAAAYLAEGPHRPSLNGSTLAASGTTGGQE